ncbi:hypothetical protein SCHRY_v1c09330 [Spiroplasma chrysopicola DF-1]|uniref:Uncharacterized protein n=1 Tax=Spiroplasma chrysopicola DF-1 TaxID=1276227 RepID=R4UJM1_9MOLU|nr:hypothetical protein SCHRY_v1c09330 [Spiroplasma chrysopicola DF-1]
MAKSTIKMIEDIRALFLLKWHIIHLQKGIINDKKCLICK